jgi:hypothetical protein
MLGWETERFQRSDLRVDEESPAGFDLQTSASQAERIAGRQAGRPEAIEATSPRACRIASLHALRDPDREKRPQHLALRLGRGLELLTFDDECGWQFLDDLDPGKGERFGILQDEAQRDWFPGKDMVRLELTPITDPVKAEAQPEQPQTEHDGHGEGDESQNRPPQRDGCTTEDD